MLQAVIGQSDEEMGGEILGWIEKIDAEVDEKKAIVEQFKKESAKTIEMLNQLYCLHLMPRHDMFLHMGE